MADTFKRLGNLIRGVGSEWMNKLEADNPEAVVRSAADGARARYEQLTRQLGRLRAQDRAAGDERSRVERELAQLRAQRGAVAEGSDVALRLDDAIARLDARLETLGVEEAERQDLSAQLEARAAELRKDADDLRAEGDSLVARSISAREVSAQESLSAGAPTRAYERALQSVRDRADQARRAADEGLPSDAELGRLKAEARLAALKAQRAAKAPAPSAVDGAPAPPDGEEPEGGDGTPPPIPQREL